MKSPFLPLLFLLLSLSLPLASHAATTKSSRTAKSTAAAPRKSTPAKATATPAKPAKSAPAAEAKPAKAAEADKTDKTDKAAPAELNRLIVKVEKATLRDKPSGKILETFTQYTPFEVLERADGWVRVKTAQGKTGYTAAENLAPHPYISVLATVANLRSGPGTDDPVVWKLKKTWPLVVLEKDGPRLKVADFEGSSGWVHESLVSMKNYVIVNGPATNLREGPGLNDKGQPSFPKRFTADKGVIFEVLEEKAGWLHLKHTDGDEGWCSAKTVWGYLPH